MKTRLIRIYQHSDIHKGWGDAYTIGYIRLNENLIEKEEIEASEVEKSDAPAWINERSAWVTERLSSEAIDLIVEILPVERNYRHWGWETTTDEKVDKERERIEDMLKSTLIYDTTSK